jgi:hypothetical protein
MFITHQAPVASFEPVVSVRPDDHQIMMTLWAMVSCGRIVDKEWVEVLKRPKLL